MTRRSGFLLLLWVVVHSVGCPQPVPPPGPYSTVIDAMEFSMTAAAGQLVQQYVEDQLTFFVNDGFENAAGVSLQWIPLSTTLPGPGTPDGAWWNTGSQNDYREYATNNGTSGGEFEIQFHLFMVGHAGQNPASPQGCGGMTYGMTLQGLENRYNFSPEDRATFMFADDVEALLDACSDITPGGLLYDSRLNVWTVMIAHELGHQRAGLTHTNERPQFHAGAYFGTDVMRSNLTIDDMKFSRTPVFCRPEEVVPSEGNDQSCRGVLLMNRTVDLP